MIARRAARQQVVSAYCWPDKFNLRKWLADRETDAQASDRIVQLRPLIAHRPSARGFVGLVAGAFIALAASLLIGRAEQQIDQYQPLFSQFINQNPRYKRRDEQSNQLTSQGDNSS